MKCGWAPLAPALQPALDAAMASVASCVEIRIDPATKAWIPDAADVDEEIVRRCVVYAACPLEKTLGKVGGSPPRSVRWSPVSLDETSPRRLFAEDPPPRRPRLDVPEIPRPGHQSSLGAAGSQRHARSPEAPTGAGGRREPPLAAASSPPSRCSEALEVLHPTLGEARIPIRDAFGGESDEEEPPTEAVEAELANDAMTFTAQPADGVVLRSFVFERVRCGATERYASHRYAAA